MAEQNDLDILFPGVKVSARGEEITVEPFKVKQWTAAIKIVRDIMPTVQKHTVGDRVNMAALMLDAADPVLDLVALGVRKPRAWIDEADADEAIELAKAVFELNRDEFLKKILPLLGSLLPAAKEAELDPAVGGEASIKS